MAGEILLEARAVSKYYGEADGRILVLKNISLEVRAGEFIALLGPSGSGKSTLLRLLAGLLSPSSGEVLVHGEPLRGTNPNVALVFQTFALFPWLTVLENVELGLLARGLPEAEGRERALRAIDLIGMDGFEHAYPRELSGGMKQRVGFARALVVEPEVLLLDEPFSALDVLVAENLRRELLDLWQRQQIPTRAILMVTHNIDEAVRMADRLLVFGSDPGCVRVDCLGLSRDERRDKGATAGLADSIYKVMTNPQADAARLLPSARFVQELQVRLSDRPLPHATVEQLTGLIEHLRRLGGREDLADLEKDVPMEADELLPLTEGAQVLGFATITEGDVVLTPAGQRFAEETVLQRKEHFAGRVLQNIELVRQIVDSLKAAPDRRVSEESLLEALEQSLSPKEARRKLDTAVEWGRYAELFAYDDAAGLFYLEAGPGGQGLGR